MAAPVQRSLQTIVSLPPFRNTGPRKRAVIRQIIKLEPNDSTTLFAMRPILELSATSRLAPFLNPLDGTIFRPESRGGYDYEVLSDANSQAPQENEIPPSSDRMKILLGMPETLKARFRKIALPLVQHLPAEGTEEAVTARARALESHLRDSGKFGYTLEMNVIDPQLDPVEDFLVNRKKGHCEYFASALALLLRSIDIPARMVNGFKGGDWNNLTQSMNVRQKHAHSWVEAYVGQDPSGSPLWITLDPTPVMDRDESVAQVGGVSSNFRPLTDMIRYVWVFYILGYDASRQNRLLYTPIKVTIRDVRRGYAMLWSWTKRGFAHLFNFQSIGAFISIKGFFVSFIVLSLLALIVRLAISVGNRLLRLVARPHRRFGRADRGNPLLSPAGTDAGRLRPGANSRRDPERVRPPRVSVPYRAASPDPGGGRGAAEDRRGVLPGPIRPPRARSGHSQRARGEPRSSPDPVEHQP